MDIQEQLLELRRKIARIDRKYATATPAPPPPNPFQTPRPARYFVEELMSGEVVETAAGAHFETEKLYESHRRHGSMDISSLIELPEDLLDSLSGGTILKSHPKRWCFLDTETTGLAGGAGCYAFLIGVGSIDEEGFRVRQFFMRDFGDEPSLLSALSAYLARFDVLITYNGKTYDVPLLETRYRMARARPPFARLAHLDLLHGARRLWKLRLDSCRLVELENRILGLEREGDLPGEMIPYYYFQYLRIQQAFHLVPIFHHNVMDIVSLACLTAVVPSPSARRRTRRSATAPIWWAWRAGSSRPAAMRKPSSYFAAPWNWACPTICCSKRCGRSPASKRSWSATTPRWSSTRTWRRPGIPIACLRSRSWRNTTSAANGITPWRSR